MTLHSIHAALWQDHAAGADAELWKTQKPLRGINKVWGVS
jgi:hypothetical protein